MNTDTIKNISVGTISILSPSGDIDENSSVQAYDAALVLQYSVGLDPIPNIDPIPWDTWRISAADVDKSGEVNANDASLILKYTVGLIDSFAGLQLKSMAQSLVDVNITVENGYILFRPAGEIYGLNISYEGSKEELGIPQFPKSEILHAYNYVDGKYKIALATAIAPNPDDVILKIPLIDLSDREIILNLNINGIEDQALINLSTGLKELNKSIEIYPNPANTILYFRNFIGKPRVTICDLYGREIKSEVLTDNHMDISDLSVGLYTVRIEYNNETLIRKLLKQ